MQRPVRSTSLLTLALLALFVVGFGLQQRVILCNHGDGAHVEFLHAPGQCCDEPTTGATAPGEQPDAGLPTQDADCVHTSFAIDLAEVPASPHVVPPLAPNVAATFALHDSNAPTTAIALHRPPGRDPPRHDRGTSIRTTTRLLL